jgi:hypothetical protein
VAVERNGMAIEPTSDLVVAPDDTVVVEIRISDWADDLPEGRLRGYDVRLNGIQGAESGALGMIQPLGWRAPLAAKPCVDGCPAEYPFCSSNCGVCAQAGHNPHLGVFLDTHHTYFPFLGLENIADYGPCDLSMLLWFALASNVGESVPDPGGGYEAYAGTLVLKVSEDACGVFLFRLSSGSLIFGPDSPSVLPFRAPLILSTAEDSEDCNINFVADECDVAGGTSADVNLNFAPDECDLDLDADGDVDLHDASAMIRCFGFVTAACNQANFFPGIQVDNVDWSAMSGSLASETAGPRR